MRDKIIFWSSTVLLSAMMLMSATMYILKTGEISNAFQHLGYPAYLVIPLACAKLLGVIAIITNLCPFLSKLAYAGFFFNFILALSAHLVAGDGQQGGSIMALAILLISYIYYRILEKKV